VASESDVFMDEVVARAVAETGSSRPVVLNGGVPSNPIAEPSFASAV
jgi:hypothetical protein